MKCTLSFLLLLISFNAFSFVDLSGTFYYDVNGNHSYDYFTDSVVANRQVRATSTTSGTYYATTDANGEFFMTIGTGTYDIGLVGAINPNYINFTQQRTFSSDGPFGIEFAFQKKKDSIVSTFITINPDNYDKIPSTGAVRQYQLKFGYEGAIPSMPASVTLDFNPKAIFINSTPAPVINTSGKLRWNFANIIQSANQFNPNDVITFSMYFPAVGDTVGAFLLDPKFIPGTSVTANYPAYQYHISQEVEFPEPAPVGSTNGVKWLRHFAGSDGYEEGKSIDTTQDGAGFFITGRKAYEPDSLYSGNTAYFIAKLNKDGLSVWEKYLFDLQEVGIGWLSAIRHTPDGGCLVLGVSTPLATSPDFLYRNLVAKFDSSGNFVWKKTFGGSKSETSAEDLLVLQDGSCLITGSTYSYDGDFAPNYLDTVESNIFVTKLSPTGNIVFSRIYGGTKEDYANRLSALKNGTFIVLGSTKSNNGDVVGAHPRGIDYEYAGVTYYNEEAWVLNIDGNGNVLWSRCFGGSGESYLGGAIDNNGGILMTGVTNSKDGDLPYYPESAVSLWVLQVSNTGNILWSKLHKLYKGYQDSNYLATPIDGFYDNSLSSRLHKSKDGNFVAGGNVTDRYGSFKNKHGFTDALIMKINPSGDILWQKAIGGTNYDYLNDITLDNNDDMVFIGNTISDNDDLYQHSPTGASKIMVAKIGITNTIKGQVFIDNNGNHIKDAGEPFYSQGRINSIKRTDTIAARIFDGKYLNNVDTGNYVSSYKAVNNYYTVFPATHNTSFTNLDLSDSVDFALTPKPNVNDLEVQLVPMSTPRPGFDATYRIITKNVGTTTINNVLIGVKSDSRMTYQDASRTESGQLADSTWWGPFTLAAFGIDTLYATYTLDAPPALNNGDTISMAATANPVINDSSVANNKFSIREIVRGSFDPNDKTEVHAGTLTTTQYAGGEYLQYLIRFQNTGTDTAFFITVKDTLQSKLDPASLEIIAASHPYVFKMIGNVASWDFKKILLPDSTTNETGSHGFILFKIKPKTGLAVGDEFSNKAAIYFDYNLPVLTNQDKTVIGSNTGICPGTNTSFIAGISGSTYQWQVNTGTGFTNLANGGIYGGVTTGTLTLTAPTTTMYGNVYRCLVNGNVYSPENMLKFAVRWKGTAGTAWENSANWDCGILPNAQTAVIIPAGVPYPVVNSSTSCYSLRLSPGSMVTVISGVHLTITGKGN